MSNHHNKILSNTTHKTILLEDWSLRLAPIAEYRISCCWSTKDSRYTFEWQIDNPSPNNNQQYHTNYLDIWYPSLSKELHKINITIRLSNPNIPKPIDLQLRIKNSNLIHHYSQLFIQILIIHMLIVFILIHTQLITLSQFSQSLQFHIFIP